MTRTSSSIRLLPAAAALVMAAALCAGDGGGEATTRPAPADGADATGDLAARDYYIARYDGYRPGFLSLPSHWYWSPKRSDERSAEENFDNLSVLNEDSRADAAIAVALQRERAGEYRDAQPLYQQIIEKMPDVLYRVSENGVFVRAADYCQMRLLAMPPADLAFYRTQYDARAAEAYAEAERQRSLAGYQDIVEGMLATSWGDKAMMALGRAALDAGRYEEAWQRFCFVKTYFGGGHCDTNELAVLLAYAARKCGRPAPALPAGDEALPQGLARMKAMLPAVKAVADPAQQRCPPCVSGQDYGRCPMPVTTPFFSPAAWKATLPTDWYARDVYSSPVVTEDSVLLRHRNIVYCYSLLTGLLRWKNDMGGRVVWQNAATLAFPNEELVVSENMVYTNMFLGGPSLVALSLTTGELRWAAGPAASADEVHMRYEAAPVVEGGVVYAGYVFDNIEGDMHFDTTYGIRAFDARTGQLLWDRPVSRLPTGRFTTNVGNVQRVRIRSFSSPPALSEGTLYCNTNAGTIAALDCRTGRIKWLIRYPYFIMRAPIHDATEGVGAFLFHAGRGGYEEGRMDSQPGLWSCQPPLVYRDCLYVAPVDSAALMAVELATGKVRWSHMKGVSDPKIWTGHSYLGPGYLLGPTRSGELIAVYGSRWRAATVLNAATGEVEWAVPDVIEPETCPALKSPPAECRTVLDTLWINAAQFRAAARPVLLADDTLVLSSFAYFIYGWGYQRSFAYCTATLSIPGRKVVRSERYYEPGILSAAETIIRDAAPSQLRFHEGIQAEWLKQVIDARIPQNPGRPFKPAAVVTAERFGTVFEIRVAADEVAVAYDAGRVEQYLARGDSPSILLARAELAMAASSYAEAAALLNDCVAKTMPEQVAFREKISGLLHSLDLHLARRDILRGEAQHGVASAAALLRTSQTLPQEIQSLLAAAEGCRRGGDPVRAARILRNVIVHFGDREYSVSPLVFQQDVAGGLGALLDQVTSQAPGRMYGPEFRTALSLAKSSAPLYTSVLSPAEATITVNVGTLALARLRGLARTSPEVAGMLDAESGEAFAKADLAEREGLLRCFPGTRAGQAALEELAAAAQRLAGVEGRRRTWRLADAADAAGYRLPEALKDGRPAAPKSVPAAPILPAKESRDVAFEAGEVLRLILPRRDASNERPELVFIGGRARKRLDNKFALECYDVRDGRKLWAATDLRLKGVGQEPGFFEAFVHRQMVIVHGLFDVLAFDVQDGHLLWRYRVPSDFEIGHALAVGELLVLAGDRGTLALHVPTASPVGDLLWETKEEGGLYAAPYVAGDRLVLVRQSPDNVTVRRLGSGQLVGRMALPGLATATSHPLLASGEPSAPAAHAGDLLLLTDGWSYMLIDTSSLSFRWKREIDSNDPAVVPPMRIALDDRVAVVTKKDYDRGSMYGIDVATGEVRWKTDPKEPASLPPLYDVWLNGDLACGITPPEDRGVRLVAFNPETGGRIGEWKGGGFAADPVVRMEPAGDGEHVILTVAQGQKLRIQAVNAKAARLVASVEREGVGPFGVHGLASAGVCDGRLLLLTKDGLSISGLE